MTVCRFYQQGYCKFGNSCKFEHPGAGGYQNTNRFGAAGGGQGGNQNDFQRGLDKYSMKLDIMETDLTTETPTWILSSYAPGRDAPDQLFGGYPREQSFEEMRLHYMRGKAEGNEQKALAEAQKLYQDAQAQIQTAVRNVPEAARYVLDGENRHPNRLDICREGTQGAPFGEFFVGRRPRLTSGGAAAPAAVNPFAPSNNNNNAAASTFGQPSTLGQKPNPFGAPAFGQPAQPAVSAFGQPSALGAKPNPFGAPTQPAAFGQTAQPAASAFGQPSALGAKPNPFAAPTFGQTAQPSGANNQAPAFGQTTQLGQKPNPFGGTANTGPSPFAAAGNNNINNSTNNTANPFGAPQTNNQNITNNANPFGQQPSVAPKVNPFGSGNSMAPPPSNPFAAGNQIAGNGGGAAPNPFAATQPTATNTTTNPFGAPSLTPASQAPTNPAHMTATAAAAAGGGGGGNPYGPNSTKQHPPVESYASRNADGSLAAFKGKAVTYSGDGRPGIRAFDGTWTRIWFPNGPPAYCKDTEPASAAEYDEETRRRWQRFEQAGGGGFADGVMPLLPPMREYTTWDF